MPWSKYDAVTGKWVWTGAEAGQRRMAGDGRMEGKGRKRREKDGPEEEW